MEAGMNVSAAKALTRDNCRSCGGLLHVLKVHIGSSMGNEVARAFGKRLTEVFGVNRR